MSEHAVSVNRIEKQSMNGRQSQDASKIDLSRTATYCVRVTPELAEHWMLVNCKNRRIRAAHVAWLVRVIQSGGWTDNHPQPIIFSKSGILLDGQHRLTAISDSGKSVWCKIECGVPDEVRKTLDTGLPRKLEDRVVFSSDLVLNKFISQVVTSYTALKKGDARKMPNAEYEATFLGHGDAIVFAAGFMSKRQKGITRVGVSCALLEMYEFDQKKAADFAASLQVPNGTVEQARMLRDWCLRNCDSAPVVTVWYEKAVFCMNAFLEERDVNKVLSGKWTYTTKK